MLVYLSCFVGDVVERMRLSGSKPRPNRVYGRGILARQAPQELFNIMTETLSVSDEVAKVRLRDHKKGPPT